MKKESLYNIPNFITSLRLLSLIIMWILVFYDKKVIIATLLLFSGLTDFFDGYLARKLKQETKFGAKFDSAADNLLWSSVVIWLIFLMPEMLKENALIIGIALSVVIFAWLIAVVKYKRNPEFHLISNKVTSVIGFLFIIHTLLFGYHLIFLYILVTAGIITALEEILVTIKYDTLDENIKSIFIK